MRSPIIAITVECVQCSKIKISSAVCSWYHPASPLLCRLQSIAIHLQSTPPKSTTEHCIALQSTVDEGKALQRKAEHYTAEHWRTLHFGAEQSTEGHLRAGHCIALQSVKWLARSASSHSLYSSEAISSALIHLSIKPWLCLFALVIDTLILREGCKKRSLLEGLAC